MTVVLWLLAVQGAIGAFDTLYFHEWRARLPALGRGARPELVLHAARSGIYAVLFATLPTRAYGGLFAIVLAALIIAEIGITLADFVVEDAVRRPLGGVFPGERATHAIMGIIYGAMLGYLVPVWAGGWSSPTAFAAAHVAVPEGLVWVLHAMAVAVLASGARDLYAACGLPGGAYPWARATSPPTGTATAWPRFRLRRSPIP